MNTILKNAMIHYLNKRIKNHEQQIHDLNKYFQESPQARKLTINAIQERIYEIKDILNAIKNDRIDNQYDDYCHENNLPRIKT